MMATIQRERAPKTDLGRLLERITQQAIRVDGRGYSFRSVEVHMRPVAPAAGQSLYWEWSASIGQHTSGWMMVVGYDDGPEVDALSALLGVLGSCKSHGVE